MALGIVVAVRRLDRATFVERGGGGDMRLSFPGESAEYRAVRDRLLEQEIELRRKMEAVAAARPALPPGGVVPEGYAFDAIGPAGGPRPGKLSRLCAGGRGSPIVLKLEVPGR